MDYFVLIVHILNCMYMMVLYIQDSYEYTHIRDSVFTHTCTYYLYKIHTLFACRVCIILYLSTCIYVQDACKYILIRGPLFVCICTYYTYKIQTPLLIQYVSVHNTVCIKYRLIHTVQDIFHILHICTYYTYKIHTPLCI